jgi:predicted kinase
MVGLPGAGKTTLAKQLEAERSALRLTPDDWITPLYGPNLSGAKLDAVRDPVESVQWAVAARALSLGVDVVLDFGTWSRRERDDFRARAAALGARSEIRFLEVPRSELSARVAARNAALPPHAFHISDDQLDQWWTAFEPPTADELRPRELPGGR